MASVLGCVSGLAGISSDKSNGALTMVITRFNGLAIAYVIIPNSGKDSMAVCQGLVLEDRAEIMQ